MDSTTSPDQFQPEEIDVLSLYRALEQVSDHRHKRGVRYPLALVLSLVILGKLAGMTSLAGMAEWVHWRADWLKPMRPGTRARFPCASTSGKVLRRVEAEEVTCLMAAWLTRLSATRRCGSDPSRLRSQGETREQHSQVALDGKTLRGMLAHTAPDQPSQHVVALYETRDRDCAGPARGPRQGQRDHAGSHPADADAGGGSDRDR